MGARSRSSEVWNLAEDEITNQAITTLAYDPAAKDTSFTSSTILPRSIVAICLVRIKFAGLFGESIQSDLQPNIVLINEVPGS